MKIGFYITNANISEVDCSQFENGNPGIGGSEYAMLALLKFLNEKKEVQNKYVLLANSVKKTPPNITSYEVKDIRDALLKSTELGIDILVFKHSQSYIDNNVFGSLDSSHNLKLIVWAHNFVTRRYLNYYVKNRFINRIVNVSNDQLNLYRDHKAYEKSTAIYNGISIKNMISNDFSLKKNEVTYIGSIIPAKGFHILAKEWKKVLMKNPDAILNVIGSGSLYDRNQKLGVYGIAESSYEEQFMPFLINDKGEILDSVKFHGVLGFEKNEILKKTKVGVPNPSGLTETYGYTAIEMQAFSALVTTKKSIGYRETVYDKSNLYSNEDKLGDIISTLLSVQKYDDINTIEFIKNNFSFEIVSKKWEKLFDNIKHGISPEKMPVETYTFEFKLIEFNRKIKKIIPYGFEILPSIAFYKSILSKLKK